MSKAREYISLSDAAIYSGCYSQEYLSLRARQGKLKATKFGRNWITTKEWIDKYIKKVEIYIGILFNVDLNYLKNRDNLKIDKQL